MATTKSGERSKILVVAGVLTVMVFVADGIWFHLPRWTAIFWFVPLVWQCIRSGWNAWTEFGEAAPDLRAPLSKRSRATFVYDHIIWNSSGALRRQE